MSVYVQLPALKEKYISLMVDRFGYVPPCEATLPCHDICHIFDEVKTHGLIRYRNLFKYERMNSFMKQNLKNRAHGIASIMKNYNTHERTTMSGTLYLDNVVKFQSLSKLQPVNGLPFQSLSSYITSIHVEPPAETGEDRTILYDVPSSNVIEFRGMSIGITLTYEDINYLLADNIDLCYEEGFSVLKLIMVGYKSHVAKYPLQFKNDILGYMRYLLDGSHPNAYRRVLTNYIRCQEPECRLVCESDLDILRNLAVHMETPTLDVRLVICSVLKYP
jgi:hypothetical protein